MKYTSDTVSVVIPLYNNADTLEKQLNQLIRSLSDICRTYQILICDDKSTDKSLSLLQTFRKQNPHINLMIHKQNRGIAPTLRDLYEHARYEYIVLFSLDGDWKPDDVARLIQTRKKTEADMVIGVRDKSVYSPYRRLISSMYDMLTRLIYGIDAIDAGSIKIFRRKLYKEFKIQSHSIFIEAELIVKAKRGGYKVQSIPISFHKKVRGSGAGSSIGNILSTIRDLVWIRFTYHL